MNPFNETAANLCPEETPEGYYILFYCCIAFWMTGKGMNFSKVGGNSKVRTIGDVN